MSDEIQGTNQGPSSERTGLDAQPEQSVDLDRDSTDLALRFLVGLLALGGDEAARRLQDMQRKLDEDPTLWSSEMPAGEKTLRRQAWHLGVGMMKRGQRRLRRGIRSGYDLSLRAANRISSTSALRGDSRLTRPFSKPIGARLVQWRDEAALMVKEGELEEQKGRALATGTLAELILEVLDEVAKNPELQEFVQDLMGQQGIGMATSVVDNARSASLTADDAADGLLRWLLRRTPRRELPPSPVEGQPQAMYAPTAKVEGAEPDVD